jgi:hypothetical protein
VPFGDSLSLSLSLSLCTSSHTHTHTHTHTQPSQTAGDVSERNMLALMYELAAAKPFPGSSEEMLKGAIYFSQRERERERERERVCVCDHSSVYLILI